MIIMHEQEFSRSFLISDQHCIPITSMMVKHYKKGSYIYEPEEIASDIYIIKKGMVKIVYPSCKNNHADNQITKSLLSNGQVFGEMVLIGEHTRRDYACVIEDTELQIYTKKNFQILLQSNPYIHHLVLQQVGQKLMTLENRFAAIILEDARSRIIDFLLKLAQDKGVKVGFDTMVDHFLTQQEIANYTATARQTVSTVLNRLRDKNLIYYTRKKLLIRDVSLLKQELFMGTKATSPQEHKLLITK